jgi:Cysteine-rich secretory protein family
MGTMVLADSASDSNSSSSSPSSSSSSSASTSDSSSASSGSGAKYKGKYIKPADILKAINDCRKKPADWATKIDVEYIKNMDKDKVTHTKWKRKFVEGLPAMEDAKKFLQNAKPKEPVTLSYGMSFAAHKHSIFLLPAQKLVHTGKNGSSMSNRLEEFGDWQTTIGENMLRTTKDTRTAELIVLEWIIDDGVKNRGHRENLFKTTFKKIGVGIANEGNGEDIVTVAFSGGFVCKKCKNIPKDAPAQMGWEGKVPETNFSKMIASFMLVVMGLVCLF